MQIRRIGGARSHLSPFHYRCRYGHRVRLGSSTLTPAGHHGLPLGWAGHQPSPRAVRYDRTGGRASLRGLRCHLSHVLARCPLFLPGTGGVAEDRHSRWPPPARVHAPSRVGDLPGNRYDDRASVHSGRIVCHLELGDRFHPDGIAGERSPNRRHGRPWRYSSRKTSR